MHFLKKSSCTNKIGPALSENCTYIFKINQLFILHVQIYQFLMFARINLFLYLFTKTLQHKPITFEVKTLI